MPYQLGERPSLSAFAFFRFMMLVPFDDVLEPLHTPLPFRADYARLDLYSYVIGNTLVQGPPLV